MSNHFHILVRVPHKARAPRLDEAGLLKLLPLLYGEGQQMDIRQELERARKSGDAAWHAAILERFEARRHDLSAFMRELKQRFTLWYNRSQGRQGTLWEEKFRSVLVENLGSALLPVAAYIDLNPVRAGLARDPKDYRWSGYGEACAGVKRAREGISAMLRDSGWGGTREWSWSAASGRYRTLLYEKGEVEGDDSGEPGKRRGFSGAETEAVRSRGGKLTLAEALRCRVRYFTEGGVLGGEAFVESFFQQNRERFGPKRSSGARRMKGAEWGELRSLRDLQKGVIE